MAKSTRQAFGESLANLAEGHPEIVVLDADLSKSTRSEIFKKKFPHRFFQMGIAEANMIGTAAGLSFTGKLPFLCSFGCFLTGRFDTIRLSVAYSRANVRLVGTHSGLGIGDDGYSQMGLEDLSLMRSLPEMGVFQPMDERETTELMNFLVKEWSGPAYLRLTRQALPDLFPKDKKFNPKKIMEIFSPACGGGGREGDGGGNARSWDLGRGGTGGAETTAVGSALRGPDRSKVLCLATGATVSEALKAARDLQLRGIAMSIWNVHCLKPFDEETLQSILHAYNLVVTVEDHSVIGGLGSAVADVLCTTHHAPVLLKLGVQDRFGESGDPAELYEKFGFSAAKIAERVQNHSAVTV